MQAACDYCGVEDDAPVRHIRSYYWVWTRPFFGGPEQWVQMVRTQIVHVRCLHAFGGG